MSLVSTNMCHAMQQGVGRLKARWVTSSSTGVTHGSSARVPALAASAPTATV